MSSPATIGETIDAIDISDCVMPSTTPCSCRPACCVIRLVSAGRMTPLPNAASVPVNISSTNDVAIPRPKSPFTRARSSASTANVPCE